MTNRREFLKGTAWMGMLAATSSVVAKPEKLSVTPGMMSTYAASPIPNLRVGVIGVGMRGPGAVHRLSMIPGVTVVAISDLYEKRVQAQVNWLKKRGKPVPRRYFGNENEWKKLCESDLDLVYIASPWQLHAPMGKYAMECGKHAAIEVPSAMTLEECYMLVETSERTKRHCMQLENCCYGDVELMTLNLARKGLLGEIVHAEGAYIHDLRDLIYRDPSKGGYQGFWRYKWNRDHNANIYATHGLVPLMQAMNINRGDRFDYLTSIATASFGMQDYARIKFGAKDWRATTPVARGDMSTTVIRTVKGKTIMVQHDVTSPRPYSRLCLCSGTRGIVGGYPTRVALAKKPGDGAHHWMKDAELKKFREENNHPLWKTAGELAKKIGGHGGMDFLMDLRLCYCLQNGLPLDMDVYDLAASCAICELSGRSIANRGATQDIPDFTRGGWETAKPLGIVNIDFSKLRGFKVVKDKAQLNV